MFRPIDSQVTLAADMMRNNAAIMRQGDTTQAYYAVHAKATAEHDQQSVAQLSENAKAKLDSDTDGGQAQQYQGIRLKNQQKKKDLKDNSDELFVLPDPNGGPLIDISI
ncbi:MAG: hypothetical protein LBN43_05890 [Oscillospiraceae bacterium]|jgi:hypothetical protein|nr:hypothetical protein [Oscillospiraceae bacterium]